MSEFNFKSQRATTIEQSERLIALGLRKETADMTHHYLHSTDSYELKDIEFSRIMHLQELVNKKPVLGKSGDGLFAKDIPAWGLHRLIEMMPEEMYGGLLCIFKDSIRYEEVIMDRLEAHFEVVGDNMYENAISCIEWLIKEGYFNKEYLV